jgi:hypothetical protein
VIDPWTTRWIGPDAYALVLRAPGGEAAPAGGATFPGLAARSLQRPPGR